MSSDKVRYFAAAMTGINAVFYYLIAAHVLPVVDVMDKGITTFGLVAGAGFTVAALVLVFTKRRWIWITGAILQIVIIAIYFKVGADRTPNYEIWGLVMRAPQALIVLSLAYLATVKMPKRVKPTRTTPSLPLR
jgi:hypothetical protein